MTACTVSLSTVASHLRPLDISRDLNAVADLIESCFADTLDRDGYRFIQSMRNAARGARYLGWTGQTSLLDLGPLSGFVWEEDGRIVGNLSLIPFSQNRKRIYLIANVAVHPAYRRRGIARTLTCAALEHVAQRGAHPAWLHVRDDNPAAYRLYQSLGFVERFQRTTWHNDGNPTGRERDVRGNAAENSIQVKSFHPSHWEWQRIWFNQTYPSDLTWYYPFNLELLCPGWRGGFRRLMQDVWIRQYSLLYGKELVGVATWQAGHGYHDYLWLSIDPEQENLVLYPLLQRVNRQLARRTLLLDYPAGRAQQVIEEAGFKPHHTLIWMQARL